MLEVGEQVLLKEVLGRELRHLQGRDLSASLIDRIYRTYTRQGIGQGGYLPRESGDRSVPAQRTWTSLLRSA